jgi:hypothetical protein
MHASLIFCSTSASINVQKIFKIVLAKAFDLKCVIQEIDAVGEPVLLYVNICFLNLWVVVLLIYTLLSRWTYEVPTLEHGRLLWLCIFFVFNLPPVLGISFHLSHLHRLHRLPDESTTSEQLIILRIPVPHSH